MVTVGRKGIKLQMAAAKGWDHFGTKKIRDTVYFLATLKNFNPENLQNMWRN